MSQFALGAAGLLSGIGGSLLGGSSSARAARVARDTDVQQFRQQQGLVGNGVFGSSYGDLPYYQYLYAQGLHGGGAANGTGAASDMTRQGLQGIQNFNNSQGGSILDQQRQLAQSVTDRQTGNLGRFDADTNALSQMGNYVGGQPGALYAQQGGQLNGLAAGAEALAGSTGIGRDRIIRRDSAQQQNAMNQQSRAGLAAAGFGNSTAVGSAMRGNAQAVGQQRERALQENTDSRLGAQLGARSQRLQVGQNILSGQADAMHQAGQAQIGREYQRAGDRQTLENQNLTRDIGLRQDPINLQYQTLTGAELNPYSQYRTQVNPNMGSSNALATLGAGLAAGGNYLTNSQALAGIPRYNPNDLRPGGAGGVYGPGSWG